MISSEGSRCHLTAAAQRGAELRQNAQSRREFSRASEKAAQRGELRSAFASPHVASLLLRLLVLPLLVCYLTSSDPTPTMVRRAELCAHLFGRTSFPPFLLLLPLTEHLICLPIHQYVARSPQGQDH